MGIDYGMGKTNIDKETGIRFGVISIGSVLQAWADSSEADYGEPTCPKCGNAVEQIVDITDEEMEKFEQYSGGCTDYVCADCEITLDSSDAYGDEPQCFKFEDDGYEAVQDGDSTEIMIVKSPFFTHAPFCSPCFPGAGNLDSADSFEAPLVHGKPYSDLPMTYCFGHDWFDGGVAPYPVYSVASGLPVFPDAWYGHNIKRTAWGDYRGFHSPVLLGAIKSDYCA